VVFANRGFILLKFLKHQIIHVRQPLPASLAVKKKLEKIGPGGIQTGALIWQNLAVTELNQ
jgi:hypothetical protein